jgi:cytochrome b6-f complex iron-sulfur subunit
MHRGCTVEPAEDRLVCPCHGSEYTAEGEVLKGPTQRALISYGVESDAEYVYLLNVTSAR